MLTNNQIHRCLREVALAMKHSFSLEDIQHVEANQRNYAEDEVAEFTRDLSEAGNKIRVLFMENQLDEKTFLDYFEEQTKPVLTFYRDEENRLYPALLIPSKKGIKTIHINLEGEQSTQFDSTRLLKNENGEITFFAIYGYESPVSIQTNEGEHPGPVRRLFQLLKTEKQEIFYILFYAIVVGLISLIVPLGIQTTVELISGGVIFSSVYLMIGLVIVGVIVSGVLQMIQISLVEFLQRRIFTKAAFEFAYRIPRIRLEAMQKNYAPELINRFFDVMTIQKGLPKLLIDLSSASIQILFGLLLISLYHPFFVFFGLILLSTLGLIFYLTGPRGLNSSIQESKYKYKVAQWLEELARAIQSFKLAGSTELPLRKTDYNVNSYLKNRKIHFNVLLTQYSFIVLFKACIIGGLLILGTILVVDRQITLGQLVASEIVIILILGAVEKIIMYMDVVYDLLTAVDKVAHVTDLPIERTGGYDFPKVKDEGFSVRFKDLKYKYKGSNQYALNGINLEISAGEKICLTGSGGAGKTTLVNVLAGLYSDYEGVATINHFSLRDLDLTHLRDYVAKNISQEDLFDGTLIENLTVGKISETVQDAIEAMRTVGILDTVNAMPDGLNTQILSGGIGLSSSFCNKLILARCLTEKPRLLILNDLFHAITKKEKMELLGVLHQAKRTIIYVSNDPLVMSACDRVVILADGKIKSADTMDNLMKNNLVNDLIS
ncbi:MAG: ATP-binding cassette domain-containing protein [Chryseotalea sp. WA131a]|jgi:ABC-type bacteriocin/lantibiotic exporter with double-glycine peptidase domain|nr:MAG: ATP-binding cassette domain-containing protein [Chryseotalea sp. WA131a]